MTATAHSEDKIGPHSGLAGTVKCLPLTVSFDDAALTDETPYVIGTLPGHVLVIGAELIADDLDTGTEAIELDFGWAANGAEQTDGYTDPAGPTYTNAGYQASQTGFVDSGVLTGDANTSIGLAAGLNWRRPFFPKPLYFKRATDVVMHVEAIADTQAAGDATLYLYYIIP
jgi:hypothetical protein